MEEGGAARPEEEKTTATPLALRSLLVSTENDDKTAGEDASPESPSRSSRDVRAVARAFTAQYYRDLNNAPSRVKRYYTVRAFGASIFCLFLFQVRKNPAGFRVYILFTSTSTSIQK